MIGFETDVKDLRKASGFVEDAAHAAETARRGVDGLDMPEATGPQAIIGGFNPFGGGPTTAFGGSLGMRQVAAAYEYHRSKVEEALAKLAFTTQQASHALARVADLYESADAEARMGVRNAAGEGL
ncbi:hypothetical protein [Amycolatopsis circi]|uniref:hypothetical protein n=1 Tax=Amycolatopsis circi TaxID=871959 RepID=UPI00142E11AF|nr:hypothetical protein [Amycolatopsis circi]